MFVVQGSSYKLPIKFFDANNMPIDISYIKEIRFIFNDCVKTYSENDNSEVKYNDKTNEFIVELSSKETSSFNTLEFQARITFTSGEVENTILESIIVIKSNKNALEVQ